MIDTSYTLCISQHYDWICYLFHFSYQNGPDTYLLQLRDVDFPVRLREYMKVANNRSPGFSMSVSDTYDWRVRDISFFISSNVINFAFIFLNQGGVSTSLFTLFVCPRSTINFTWLIVPIFY